MRTSSIVLLLATVSLRSASAFFLPPPPPPPFLFGSKVACKKKQKKVTFLAGATIAGKLLASKQKKKGLIRKKQKKNAMILFGAAATGAAVVTTAGAAAAAAAVVANSNKSKPYQPPPDSMRGKIVVITGGSSGLGLESAKRLASAGATIVLTARSLRKGEDGVQAVKDYLLSEKSMTLQEQPPIYNLVLDLDDLASAKSFPESFQKLFATDDKDQDPVSIDVLLNNAGVMAIPRRELTLNGFERTFQSNHLGHFVLTAGLLPFLNSERSTIINVASDAYQLAFAGLDLDNLNGEKNYTPWNSYGLSKLCNILFTQELQRRADAAGLVSLTTVAVHPGAVGTNLWRYIVGEKDDSLPSQIFNSVATSVSSAVTKCAYHSKASP